MKPKTLSYPTSQHEHDAITRWRHYMTWKPGERHTIKAAMSRRERRLTRTDLHVGRLDRV